MGQQYFKPKAELDLLIILFDHTGQVDFQVGVPVIYPNPFDQCLTLSILDEGDQISILKAVKYR